MDNLKDFQLTRRQFLIGAGAGAVIGAAGIAGVLTLAKPATSETKPPAELKPVTTRTVGEFTKLDALMVPIFKAFSAKVYGLPDLELNDWVLTVPKPPPGKGMVVGLLGVTGMGQGKSKSGEIGMFVQFQHRTDTKASAVYTDVDHTATDMVHRANNSRDTFLPLYPAQDSDKLDFRGWAEVDFPDGQKRPILSVVGETPEAMFLYVPVTALRKKGYSPNIAKIFTYEQDLAFPAKDK